MIGSLVLFGNAGLKIFEQKELDQNGITTSALVEDYRLLSGNRRGAENYMVYLEFETDRGKTVHVRKKTASVFITGKFSTFNTFQSGGIYLDVTYNPKNPGHFIFVKDEGQKFKPYVNIGWGLALSILSVFVFSLSLSSLREKKE